VAGTLLESERPERRRPEPVLTGELLPPLHAELVALLRSLPPEAWMRRTSAGPWRVRDVVAHLLDGDLRRISLARDRHMPPVNRALANYRDLLDFLNELNAIWVRAATRISVPLLLDLVEHVGAQATALLRSLDPFAPALLPVAWAGEERSLNWMDIGREYTERWHHQDQVREAVGAQPLFAARWLAPVVAISMHALPRAYAHVSAQAGTRVVVAVTGDAGGAWTLERGASAWTLFAGGEHGADCRITLDARIAGRLLLHRLAPSEIEAHVAVEGDARLGRPFLAARAVMV
jgi:hypothetical protein